MNCPVCGVAHEATELHVPSRGEATKAILKEPRTWLVAFAVMLASALIVSALGLGSSVPSVGGGAAIGIYIAARLARARSCPSCRETFFLPE